jgi:REP element-mobilizing transposase RayT
MSWFGVAGQVFAGAIARERAHRPSKRYKEQPIDEIRLPRRRLLPRQITPPYILERAKMSPNETEGGKTPAHDSSFGPEVEAQHGGPTRTGQRKTSRPLEPTLPLYLALRSSRARGKWSLLRPSTESRLQEILRELSQRHGVKVFEFANGGDQIHLLLRAKSRAGFQAFLRAFAGLTARLVTGAKKGKPSGKFWDALTYSRVLAWGKEFDSVRELVAKGNIDALEPLARPKKKTRATSAKN